MRVGKLRLTGILAAVVALAVLVAACGGDEEQSGEASTGGGAGATAEIGEHTLTFAYTTPESFPYHDGAVRFKELVEEQSGGKIEVKLFPGGQLGAERDIEEGILGGTIHLGIGAGALAGFAPIANLLELPFLIKDQEHMKSIAEGEVGQMLAERIQKEAKFKVLDWFSTGNSAIQTTTTPITGPDDLKGIKLRVMENEALVDVMNTLGANPTPLPYPEIYTALQQGVIEGSHVDWNSVVSLKLYESIKQSTGPDSAFLAEPRPIIMSESFFEQLNPAEQKLIQDAMTEASTYQRDVMIDRMEEAIAETKENGVNFTEIDEEAFLEAVQPVWQRWATKLNAEDILKQIEDLRPKS